MLNRVLIANRGEIAVRVARACREFGISPVAVYSDADRDALHVRICDAAYRLGPPPAAESYLNVAAILDAARAAGADAIHPGYGFLSENPRFAEACTGAGITFIGPPADAMRAMGDKVRAKVLMREAGVPVVLGWEGDSDDLSQVAEAVSRLPLPLLVKAAAGGGGRGMRVVRELAELPEALAGARREALAACGDGRLFVERYVERPRHIEIQIMGDRHGNVIHLGERECSIQRRHQKIVEEAPSPAVSTALRAEMGEAAVRAARAVGYTNAGTVEFIMDQAGNYYFLEMNTRLQVEHPVTELATGLDLVHLQLRVAAGEPLPLRQPEIALRGHAIECRLYAEDPTHGYLPSTGPLLVFAPPTLPGVRHDAGFYQGAEVTAWYDPMLAKVIVHASTRGEAIDRMRQALAEYGVLGVRTNQTQLLALMAHPAFRAGELHTGFLAEHPLATEPPAELTEAARFAAAAWHLDADRMATATAGRPPEAWRDYARHDRTGLTPVRLREAGGAETAVLARRPLDGDGWTMWPDIPAGRGEGRPVALARTASGAYTLRAGERQHRVFLARAAAPAAAIEVGLGGYTWEFRLPTPLDLDVIGRAVGGVDASGLVAPMPGKIVKISVAEGEAVEAGQPLLVLEAMKMEHAIHAPAAARVRRLPFAVGDMAPKGAALVELEET